jgi:ubiquinone/menaquinone biosynthesis C-methylase UbiE
LPEENLQRYYDLRAEEYEHIYYRPDDPVRQEELSIIESEIPRLFAGRHVLEIACGTGYWTEILASVAESVVAIDTSPEMLKLASRREYSRTNIAFRQIDAYQLESLDQNFTGGMANFWFSHVPKSQIDEFLNGFHRSLQIGSPVLIADNILVPGLGGEFVERDDDENTYKLRQFRTAHSIWF